MVHTPSPSDPQKHSFITHAIQIKVLRELHGLANESFIIYHADELHERVQPLMDRLEALPNVKIKNLASWYNQVSHPHQPSSPVFIARLLSVL